MPCKQCQRNRQRALEKRRLIDQKKRQRLAEACARGDQSSCKALQQMDALAEYRQQHRYRSEHHRRAG